MIEKGVAKVDENNVVVVAAQDGEKSFNLGGGDKDNNSWLKLMWQDFTILDP